MPTIHIMHHRTPIDTGALLAKLNRAVASAANLPAEKIWLFWHSRPLGMSFVPRWKGDGSDGPIVRVFCRKSHSSDRVKSVATTLQAVLSDELTCKASDVFVQVVRISDEEVFGGA